MTLLGNIALSIATLLYVLLLTIVYGKAPARSGDGLGGYAMSLLFLSIGLLVFFSIATITVAIKGGFDWVLPGRSGRYWLVAGGMVAAIVTVFLSAIYKLEGDSGILRFFCQFIPFLLPLAMIVSGFVLLQSDWRAAVPPAVYQWLLTGVAATGAIGMGIGMYQQMALSAANRQRMQESAQADELRYHNMHMADVDSCALPEHMSRILVFTDANHEQSLRDHALAKIKSHPGWQQELVRLLENKGAIEAFQFLASNDPDDPKLFVEPVNTGLLSIADWIRRRIREASHEAHFYPDIFQYEVARALGSATKLEAHGGNYRAAVEAIRAALDEPSDVKKPAFRVREDLDNWLKKRR